MTIQTRGKGAVKQHLESRIIEAMTYTPQKQRRLQVLGAEGAAHSETDTAIQPTLAFGGSSV
jgi:hypothetical protein